MKTGAARSLARHALGWLVAANAVGVLLAVLLLWPEGNTLFAPFTYGRWMPLHLDWQLYGWCALPLVGALLAGYADPADESASGCSARLALRIWSLALLLGGVSWLGGTVSGKLFLDWAGWARPLLPLAMGALWWTLAASLAPQWAHLPGGRKALLTSLLAVLAAVPFILYHTTGPDGFPAVNPDSGGATGNSLLGSTLGVIAIGGLLPVLLRRPRMETPGRWARLAPWFWPALLLSFGWFGLRPHGDVSHHDAGEILSLALLFAWIPLTFAHFSSFAWPAAAGRWLRASAGWWLALVVSGWLMFLPGVAELAKFTHGLVAHSHLAMGGMASSVAGAVLATLGRAPGRDSAGFWWWQGACVGHVLTLLLIGVFESADQTWLWSGGTRVTALFAVRLFCGLIQLGVSVHWLHQECR